MDRLQVVASHGICYNSTVGTDQQSFHKEDYTIPIRIRMYSLYRLPDDTFSIKRETRSKLLLRSASLEEAVRILMIALDIPGPEVLAAIGEMERTGANVAEFGMQRTFVTCRTVNYRDN